MPIQKKENRHKVTINKLSVIEEIQVALIKWGRKNWEEFAWRTTCNQFHVLIAEVMLQRTRAEQVEDVYQKFCSLYSTPRDAMNDDPEKIRELLRPLGLRWRSEKILELIKTLCHTGNNIPQDMKQLMCLPGVGSYVASAYLSLHAGVRMSIIDSNVVRLWGRVFGFETDPETRRKRWFVDLADEITPTEDFKDFNYAILDLTRNLCKTKPLHDLCPLTSVCKFYVKAFKC